MSDTNADDAPDAEHREHPVTHASYRYPMADEQPVLVFDWGESSSEFHAPPSEAAAIMQMFQNADEVVFSEEEEAIYFRCERTVTEWPVKKEGGQ